MANIKLLQEAIQAFASGETKAADAKVRKFFIEQAQEINKKFEKEMNESLDGGQQSDFEDEVEFKFDDGKGSEGWEAYDDEINEAEEKETSEFEPESSDELSVEVDSVEEPKSEEDPWEGIKDAFDELESLFAELEGDVSGEEEVEVQSDEGSEFDDVDFGDESFRESVEAGRMKKVVEPKEKAADSRSPVAGQPEAFVKGVEPVDIKDGSVDIKTTENSTTMSQVDVDDNDNVMDNAKGLMKNVKEPKTTPEKSRSPLPKSSGK